MQAGMHEIAANVIVHYKASASVVFLCLFILIIISMTKLLDADCLRGVQLFH